MCTIVNDLNRLRRLPREFKLMTSHDIKCLVRFWKEEGLSIATIGNKLSVLRRFNQLARLELNIPSNKELGCVKALPTPPKKSIPENYENKIFHPITRSLIALQLHFGLTKLEAIRVNPTCIVNGNVLLIGRTIAHNKKDRTIPVITNSQKSTLSERKIITKTSQLLKKQESHSLINRLYTVECFDAGIDPKTPFRRHYAQARLNALEKTQDKQSALLVLCKEMGFSAPRKLLVLLS